MSKGFDTIHNCAPHAASIKNAGYSFVCRYYNVNDSSKNLTLAEAKALSASGLYIVAVWENGYPTTASYFSYQKGLTDGQHAYEYAKKTIGQPAGKPIYFAVDYDASTSEIAGPINDYFKGVADAFSKEGSEYKIGVYGSGMTCQWLLNNNKSISYTWLSQSTGWGGYKSFTAWNIKQGPDINVFGMDSDSDESNDNAGGFMV